VHTRYTRFVPLYGTNRSAAMVVQEQWGQDQEHHWTVSPVAVLIPLGREI
jgi:hypothetical protein